MYFVELLDSSMKCGIILYFYESPSYLFAYLIANPQLLSISTGCQSYNTCPVGNATTACKRKGERRSYYHKSERSLGPCDTGNCSFSVSSWRPISDKGLLVERQQRVEYRLPFQYLLNILLCILQF